MYSAGAVVNIAKSQVSYHEGRSGGHWDNRQKYAEQLPGFDWAEGQPWCAIYAQWCYWQTGVRVPSGARSASCSASVAAYKHAGRFTEYPTVGGQIFFGPGGGSHTGIVTSYTADRVSTIEGNTNDSGSAEGDGVYTKVHERRSTYVYGYGIPYLKGLLKSADPHWSGRDGGA